MTELRPYRKKRPFLLAGLVVLLALFLSFSPLNKYTGLRESVSTIFYPMQIVTFSIWHGVVSFPGYVMNLGNLAQDNLQLKQKAAEDRTKLLMMEQLVKENERLRSALGFKTSQYRFNLRSAQVLSRSPADWLSALDINKGSNDGIRAGMPVINQQGLVGKVVAVTNYSARVRLLIDLESSVVAADSRSRALGVVEGAGTNRLFMKYVEAESEVALDDLVVTSATSTVFPPGLPIGRISKAEKNAYDIFYYLELKPAVDFSKIEELYIIL